MASPPVGRVKRWRVRRAEAGTIERAVSQAARELLTKIVPMRTANPGMNLIDMVSIEALSLWFTYAVIMESKAVKRLTVALAILTAVLIVLTAKLALH